MHHHATLRSHVIIEQTTRCVSPAAHLLLVSHIQQSHLIECYTRQQRYTYQHTHTYKAAWTMDRVFCGNGVIKP
jgi:hypothetical protein